MKNSLSCSPSRPVRHATPKTTTITGRQPLSGHAHHYQQPDPVGDTLCDNNISFELTEDNSGLFKLTMYNVRFAQSMPMSLNIVIPN